MNACIISSLDLYMMYGSVHVTVMWISAVVHLTVM